MKFKNIILESPLLSLNHLILYNLAQAAQKVPHITRIAIRLMGINTVYRQNPQRVLDAIENIPHEIPLVWQDTTVHYWAPRQDRLIDHQSQIKELKKQGAKVHFYPLNCDSSTKGGHEIPKKAIPKLRQEQLRTCFAFGGE